MLEPHNGGQDEHDSEDVVTLLTEVTKLEEKQVAAMLEQNDLARQRTELAKGRTSLALIRTGLAFLTLGITLFRYFGLSMWSLFDGALVLSSAAMIYFGVREYQRSKAIESKLMPLIAGEGWLTGQTRLERPSILRR